MPRIRTLVSWRSCVFIRERIEGRQLSVLNANSQYGKERVWPHLAYFARCTRTSAKSSRPSACGRHRRCSWAQAYATTGHTLCDPSDHPVVARVHGRSRSRSSGGGHRAEARSADQDKLAVSLEKLIRRGSRPSVCVHGARKRGRHSSRVWASCTWRSSSDRLNARVQASTPTLASLRSLTAKRSPWQCPPARGRFVRQSGGRGQFAPRGYFASEAFKRKTTGLDFRETRRLLAACHSQREYIPLGATSGMEEAHGVNGTIAGYPLVGS